MTDKSQNSKRIAKNTLILYMRMLFLMLVSLYTSRVILQALGVDDYGIYNVVGGLVAMFSVLSGSLSAAISRFITFELGRENKGKLNTVFSSAVTIQILLSVVVVLIAEPVGIWFLNEKMVIPADRLFAANYVLQFTIATFVINLISVPYNASIIAHEKMSAFAYISIVEALGKLLIAYLVVISPIDRLIFYALLMFLVSLMLRLIYGIYCKKHFKECVYRFVFDKKLLKEMFVFSGWNFIGASSGVLRDQGGNIIINLFAGPAVNAARGIAYQVNGAISSFVMNFLTAVNPQITKSYASGDYKYMMTLVFQGSRLSFYMLLFLSLPVLVSTHYILSLWLGIVPEHTVSFVRLVLILAMSESISYTMITAMLATGNIKNYQIVVGGLQLLNLPISYILLRIGFIPETVIYVAIVISQCCFAARVYMLSGMIDLSIMQFMKKVYFNVLLVSCAAAIIPIFLATKLQESFISFIILSVICVITTSSSILYIGCDKQERLFVAGKVISVFDKMKNISKRH